MGKKSKKEAAAAKARAAMSTGEVLARKLANVLRALGYRQNDMHLVQMVDQAMDADDKDAVDVGGYFDPEWVRPSTGATPTAPSIDDLVIEDDDEDDEDDEDDDEDDSPPRRRRK